MHVSCLYACVLCVYACVYVCMYACVVFICMCVVCVRVCMHVCYVCICVCFLTLHYILSDVYTHKKCAGGYVGLTYVSRALFIRM